MGELDSNSFDLIEALSGVSFPEETFPVYFNSKAAHQILKVNRELDLEIHGTETFKEKEKELLNLVDEFKGSEYKVTIRGISQEHYQDALNVLIKETGAFKGSKSELEIQQYVETRTEQLLWAQHIVKIEDPQGRVRAPITNEEAEALYNKLPDESRKEIERQIEKMRNETASGYEVGITDFDFLSEPSPEESAQDSSQD